MKSGYLVHLFAVITLLLGVWIFMSKMSSDEYGEESSKLLSVKKDTGASNNSPQQADPTTTDAESKLIPEGDPVLQAVTDIADHTVAENSKMSIQPERKLTQEVTDPDKVLDNYITAWRNQNKAEVDRLWERVVNCEKCLLVFIDQIVNGKLEEGMDLEVAIKMAALDTDVVLPVFDVMIDPAGKKSTAIILSEKLINNGRPEFVNKIFDLLYGAKQSGYHHFAQQLTWVISKLENPAGIAPILDTITGRKLTNPELSVHVTNVYSKVVRVMPDSSKAASVITEYYLQANSVEQQKLWPVVSQHGRTLVTLAIDADKNGQNYNLQKYSKAMTELPHLNAVDSLIQLHTAVEYSPDYMKEMLARRVTDNPTIKVLHKLEDYMRDPDVKLESRIFAAEGLLAVRENRQARYILEKVINNTEDVDAELQAYIAGRL